MTHINELQALVIVEHASGKYNLYLSDITGEYFSLSLEDLVVTNHRTIDLEVVSTSVIIICTIHHKDCTISHRLMVSMEL